MVPGVYSELPSRHISLWTNEITEPWHNHTSKLVGGCGPSQRARMSSQRLVDPSLDTLLEGRLAKREGDTGRVPTFIEQVKAPGGGDGANWGYCPNWRGNA